MTRWKRRDERNKMEKTNKKLRNRNNKLRRRRNSKMEEKWAKWMRGTIKKR